MRYERKFQFLPCYLSLIVVFLKSNGFKEIYNKRIINSLYYESDNLDLYQDSINGLNEKQKIRLRFYDSNSKKWQIEYKKKIEFLNEKIYLDFKNNNNLIPVHYLDKNYLIKNLNAPKIIDCFYKPKVFISYTRLYFISHDKELRITLDFGIYFMKANLYPSYILIGKRRRFDKAVLEMKYRKDYYPDLKFINSICTKFGMNLTTFSKYSSAISLLNLA